MCDQPWTLPGMTAPARSAQRMRPLAVRPRPPGPPPLDPATPIPDDPGPLLPDDPGSLPPPVHEPSPVTEPAPEQPEPEPEPV